MENLIKDFNNRFQNSHFELRDVRNFLIGTELSQEEANKFFNGIFYKFNNEQIKSLGYENVELNSTKRQTKKQLLNLVKTRIGIMSVDVDDVLEHHINSIDAFFISTVPKEL